MWKVILNVVFYLIMAFSSLCMYAGMCVVIVKKPDAKTRDNAIATFMFGGFVAVIALFIRVVAG